LSIVILVLESATLVPFFLNQISTSRSVFVLLYSCKENSTSKTPSCSNLTRFKSPLPSAITITPDCAGEAVLLNSMALATPLETWSEVS
jgi:hypothetical protein